MTPVNAQLRAQAGQTAQAKAQVREVSALGPVEKAVRSDVRELGDLAGFEPLLASLAFRLAGEVDAFGPEGDRRTFVQLTRELRQTVAQLIEGRTATDDDDGLGDLASPE